MINRLWLITEFYCNFFKTWDNHSDVIVSANILRLKDLSKESVQESAQEFGISDTGFIEYLRTLGIRNYENNGSNKEAYSVLKSNLSDRNW